MTVLGSTILEQTRLEKFNRADHRVSSLIAQLEQSLFNEDNQLFCSSDMDEVKQAVGNVFKPHRLKIRDHREHGIASMHHVRQGALSLNRLQYQHEVVIDPDRLNDFFLVHIPMNGSSTIRCGNHRFVSTPENASLVSPTLPLEIEWEAGSADIILRIERARLDKHCAQHLGMQQLEKPLEFHPDLQLQTPAGQYFLRLVSMLADNMQSPYPQLNEPIVFEQFESTLFNALLYGQPHNLCMKAPITNIAPFYIKRVEDYIHAHTADSMTIESLAAIAGVSARTLFAGFQRYRGLSPMDYLRQVRLDRVREMLLSEKTAHLSVTEIAMQWGFNHMGRFAIDYKKRFGESPSASRRFGPGH